MLLSNPTQRLLIAIMINQWVTGSNPVRGAIFSEFTFSAAMFENKQETFLLIPRNDQLETIKLG